MPHIQPPRAPIVVCADGGLSVALLEGLWVQNRLLSIESEISSVCVALIFSRIDLTTFLALDSRHLTKVEFLLILRSTTLEIGRRREDKRHARQILF